MWRWQRIYVTRGGESGGSAHRVGFRRGARLRGAGSTHHWRAVVATPTAPPEDTRRARGRPRARGIVRRACSVGTCTVGIGVGAPRSLAECVSVRRVWRVLANRAHEARQNAARRAQLCVKWRDGNQAPSEPFTHVWCCSAGKSVAAAAMGRGDPLRRWRLLQRPRRAPRSHAASGL